MKFAAAKHYAFVFLHIIVFIVVSIVLFVEFFYRAIKYTYGLISIEQIIFHLKNPIDTIDFSTVIPVLPFIFLFVSTVIIYFFFTYYIFIKNDPSKVMKTLAAIMSAIRNIFGNILKLIIKFCPPPHTYMLVQTYRNAALPCLVLNCMRTHS